MGGQGLTGNDILSRAVTRRSGPLRIRNRDAEQGGGRARAVRFGRVGFNADLSCATVLGAWCETLDFT